MNIISCLREARDHCEALLCFFKPRERCWRGGADLKGLCCPEMKDQWRSETSVKSISYSCSLWHFDPNDSAAWRVPSSVMLALGSLMLVLSSSTGSLLPGCPVFLGLWLLPLGVHWVLISDTQSCTVWVCGAFHGGWLTCTPASTCSLTSHPTPHNTNPATERLFLKPTLNTIAPLLKAFPQLPIPWE